MFAFTLTLHILGAILFIGLLIATAVVLIQSKPKTYQPLAQTLAGLTAFQLATGTALFLLSPVAIALFCAKSFTYIALAGVAELLLLKRLRTSPIELLPTRTK